MIFLSHVTVMIVQPIFALFVKHITGDVKHISTLAGFVFSIAGAFTVLSAPLWGRKNDKDIKKYGIVGYRRNLILSFAGLVYLLLFKGFQIQFLS